MYLLYACLTRLACMLYSFHDELQVGRGVKCIHMSVLSIAFLAALNLDLASVYDLYNTLS